MPTSEVKNMDCMEYMAQFPDKFFELSIVEPPYGLGSKVVNSGGRFKRYENKNGNWDNNTPDEAYFEQLLRVSVNQIIWGGNAGVLSFGIRNSLKGYRLHRANMRGLVSTG